ncbi:multidrug ABC transporter ATPase [Curtobacterium sp. MCBA15_009]|uniref:multidrug ABC transporter ATPase n=1 Tax=Curtobacterium sp. MCBA15_009 TaxID=1898737 RepID=UPI001113B278|nr:multidrug ABC transporter ATPase [Curtobacterium sp. MCBA15_009]
MTFNRTERALAFMIGGIIILGVLCFIAMIIMWLTDSGAQGSMPWPVVMAIPLVGFPIAMLLVFTLLGITWTRRARANRTAR